MILQVEGLFETLAAQVANVRLFTRVSTKVDIEVGNLNEPLFADFAFKRPFARVRTQMDLEMGQKWGACLCTDVALKVLLSVYPLHCVR